MSATVTYYLCASPGHPTSRFPSRSPELSAVAYAEVWSLSDGDLVHVFDADEKRCAGWFTVRHNTVSVSPYSKEAKP